MKKDMNKLAREWKSRAAKLGAALDKATFEGKATTHEARAEFLCAEFLGDALRAVSKPCLPISPEAGARALLNAIEDLRGGLRDVLNRLVKPAHLHVLRHSLGITKGSDRSYRNHFVTGPGTDDYAVCRELCERGLMRRAVRPSSLLADGDEAFYVTEVGEEVARTSKIQTP